MVNTSTGTSSKAEALILVRNALKASLVGASTVYEPDALKVWSSPVASSAETRVLKLSV